MQNYTDNFSVIIFSSLRCFEERYPMFSFIFWNEMQFLNKMGIVGQDWNGLYDHYLTGTINILFDNVCSLFTICFYISPNRFNFTVTVYSKFNVSRDKIVSTSILPGYIEPSLKSNFLITFERIITLKSREGLIEILKLNIPR